MKKLNNYLTIVFFSLFLLFSNQHYSQGIGIIDGSTGECLTLLESDVFVQVYNQIATTKSTQVFINETDSSTIFKYAFPLNENANPIGLRWFVNGSWIEADVSVNEQDDDLPNTGGGGYVYPEITDYLGSTPLFFTPSAELESDSLIIFEITYVELLPYFLGSVSYTLKNDLSSLLNYDLESQSFIFTMDSEREIIQTDLIDLFSIDDLEPYSVVLQYNTADSPSNYNYNLEYELSSDDLGVIQISTLLPDSLLNCDTLGNGFCTFIVEPESSLNTEIIDKNFTLIIDKSGSMAGNKIIQAKEAATFIIENLNEGDNFNIITFESSVYSLFEDHVSYNLTNKATALQFIENTYSGGGTNISGALVTAISEFDVVDPTMANIIIFFTDGQASAGITDTPGILNVVENEINNMETSIFLYTFGIGESVDHALLTLLAQQNNGLVNFVGSNNLQEEITSFFLSVNNPILINTQITFDPPIIDNVFPYPYPNLYLGHQLIISGRYSQAETVNMHIEGQAFNIPVSYNFEIELSDTNNTTYSILPKIWAKQKLDELGLQYYLVDGAGQEQIQNEIDSISTCYGVISVDFTSFEDPFGLEVLEFESSDSRFKIVASPNPFDDRLTITLKSIEIYNEEISIEIIDLQGNVVISTIEKLIGNSSSFEISGVQELKPGIYICRIIINNEVIILKIIKK